MSACPNCKRELPADREPLGGLGLCGVCGVPMKFLGGGDRRSLSRAEILALPEGLKAEIRKAQCTQIVGLPPPAWAIP